MPKLLEKTFVDKPIGIYPGVILSLPWKPDSNFIQISAVIVPQYMSPDWPKFIVLISFPFVITLWLGMDLWPHYGQ